MIDICVIRLGMDIATKRKDLSPGKLEDVIAEFIDVDLGKYNATVVSSNFGEQFNNYQNINEVAPFLNGNNSDVTVFGVTIDVATPCDNVETIIDKFTDESSGDGLYGIDTELIDNWGATLVDCQFIEDVTSNYNNSYLKEIKTQLHEDWDDDESIPFYRGYAYYSPNYRGVADVIETTYFDELEEWIWDMLQQGLFVETFDESGKNRFNPEIEVNDPTSPFDYLVEDYNINFNEIDDIDDYEEQINRVMNDLPTVYRMFKERTLAPWVSYRIVDISNQGKVPTFVDTLKEMPLIKSKNAKVTMAPYGDEWVINIRWKEDAELDESLINEERSYSEDELVKVLNKLTNNFTKEDGTLFTYFKDEKDIAKKLLKDKYNVVNISDARMSDNEEMNWCIAYSHPKDNRLKESFDMRTLEDIMEGGIDNLSDEDMDEWIKIGKKLHKFFGVKKDSEIIVVQDSDYYPSDVTEKLQMKECEDCGIKYAYERLSNGNIVMYFASEEDADAYYQCMENDMLTESVHKFKCCICDKEVDGWGNNPYPVVTDEDAECCDECNWKYVIP